MQSEGVMVVHADVGEMFQKNITLSASDLSAIHDLHCIRGLFFTDLITDIVYNLSKEKSRKKKKNQYKHKDMAECMKEFNEDWVKHIFSFGNIRHENFIPELKNEMKDRKNKLMLSKACFGLENIVSEMM